MSSKAGTMAVDSTPSSKETVTVIDNPFEMDKIESDPDPPSLLRVRIMFDGGDRGNPGDWSR